MIGSMIITDCYKINNMVEGEIRSVLIVLEDLTLGILWHLDNFFFECANLK